MTNAEYAADLKRYIRLLQAELRSLETAVTPAPPSDRNSDHAVLRYLERVKNVDMRRLWTEILPHERRGLLKAGLGRIKCAGYELVCQKGVLATVVA